MSYGECEATNGAASNAAFNSTFQQAVAEGVSVFVASGDNATAFCDRDDEIAISGIGITGWGSSPYDVAVGGTDFGDTFAGTNSTYWSGTNSPTYESAKSYVPEIPWNDSCGSLLLAEFEGYGEAYGASGFCNSSKGETDFLNTIGGGGGPSGCATGTPSISGVVGGTCAGWPKPSYQSLIDNPSDGVRDIPDVSLFAANGIWLHYYPYCFTGPGGVPCTEAPVDWPAAGGTSFTAPLMAGIQALVNQKAGSSQGNPNFVYYSLAATQYGTTGDKACNSTLGDTVGSSCIFYDVSLGDNDLPCSYTPSLGIDTCYTPSGSYGVQSTSSNAYEPAYEAAKGWDFATGIGTVNAYNLVNNWPSGFTLSASPNSLTITQGGSGMSTITIIPANGFSGNITLSAAGLPNGVTAAFSPNPTTTASTLTLTASATAATGTFMVTIIGTSGTATQLTTLSLTVNSTGTSSFSLSASPSSVTIAQSGSAMTTITIIPVNGFNGNVTLSAAGLPNGVTAAFSPNPATTTSALTLTASATAVTGTITVTITGTSGNLTQTTAISVTVTAAPGYTLSAAPSALNIVQGSQGTSAITITPLNGFVGTVTLFRVRAAKRSYSGVQSESCLQQQHPDLDGKRHGNNRDRDSDRYWHLGSLAQTVAISLTVTPAPSFTLSAAPGALRVAQGSQGEHDHHHAVERLCWKRHSFRGGIADGHNRFFQSKIHDFD